MDATFLTILRLSLEVLSERLIILLSLGMTFVLSLWVMYDPSQLRMYVAGGFAVLVFIPSVMKGAKNERQQRQERND